MNTHYIRKGYLYRERAIGVEPVCCPFSSNQEESCGDWCALFHQETRAVILHCGERIRLHISMEGGGGPPKKFKEGKDKYDSNTYPSNPEVKDD